jgi:hypothetical protein
MNSLREKMLSKSAFKTKISGMEFLIMHRSTALMVEFCGIKQALGALNVIEGKEPSPEQLEKAMRQLADQQINIAKRVVLEIDGQVLAELEEPLNDGDWQAFAPAVYKEFMASGINPDPTRDS